MLERLKRIRLLYVVLAVLLLVGLLPLTVAGILLSRRSAEELRAIEGRYQAQLVRDKARQIELYGQRYREVVIGLARAFEITGGNRLPADAGYDARLQKSLQDDPNLIALAICPVKGEVHRAFQVDLIKREEVDQRISEVLARMSGRGVVIGRPQVIRSGQEMGLTIAAPVMNGEEITAAVIAVVSFQEVFKAVQQSSSRGARELMDAGLPVVFVVDPAARVLRRRRSTAFALLPTSVWAVVPVVALHLALVYIASRVAGLRHSLRTAVTIVLLELFISGAMLFLFNPPTGPALLDSEADSDEVA